MHPRIEEILGCLDAELSALCERVNDVAPEQRTQRPTPGRWSVAEVLEHLAMVEATILKVSVRQLAAARESGLAAETETSSVLAMLPTERIANRETPLTAPDTLRPQRDRACVVSSSP